MDSLLTHVIAWPTMLVSLLIFGFAPGAVLRVIVLAYRRDDPRRTELRGELFNVPRIERPFWVFEQLENALFEGLAGRLAKSLDRKRDDIRRSSLPSEVHGNDTVSRYLDLLEGSVAALRDFESRKQGHQAVPYKHVRPAEGSHLLRSIYWMTVADHANLSPGASVELDKRPGLRGMVTAVSERELCVRFDVPVSQLSLPAQGALLRSRDDRLYLMQRQAITRLRQGDAANPQLIRVLADRTFLPFTPDSSIAPGMPLDHDQVEAVSRACTVPDFLFVTSPPGSGRTHVTCKIIERCVQRGERVLVIGATNAGVGSLLSRLPADIATFRVGEPDPLSHGQVQVVAGTAARMTLSGITTSQAFDLLVIVEAEKVSLPSAIAPLVSARRVVLIGDPRQLPLFVDPEMLSWLRQLTAGSGEDLPVAEMEALLTTSLFELLLTEAPVTHKVVLRAQYRMPSAVADFVSRNFYDGMLSSRVLREPLVASPLPYPFTIVDTSCLPPWERRELRSARSYVNRAEANIISAIVTAEDGRGRDWAVAVPYAAQASLIREQLRQSLGRAGAAGDLEVRVGTIDSFSGREHDLVIIGCTRSNEQRSVGFLRELRRFNVAMTRARRQLVVVGDMETLTGAYDRPVRELMRAMSDHVRRCGEIIGADTVAGRLR